jgi:undecaprenyl diphosphate synthase
MDGNRRWAKQKGLPAAAGHLHGAEALIRVVNAASKMGIRIVTAYAFSTENWRRSSTEISMLMRLFRRYLRGQMGAMTKEGVRLRVIGDRSGLPESLRETIDEVERATAGGEVIDLVIALNYGGRDEIRRAVRAVVKECLAGNLREEEVSEEVIGRHLDTASWRDPELVIRTGGERRISNFLLWQISYAEVYISDVLWPDFNEEELARAVVDFQRRERRVGG